MSNVIRDASGNVIMDLNFRCFQITAEGSFTVTTGPWQIFTITYPQRPATFVCIRTWIGNQYLTGAPRPTQMKFASNLSVGSVIEWKVASVAQDGLEGAGGLVVRDAGGSTVFTAARKPALIAGYVSGMGLTFPLNQLSYSPWQNGPAFETNQDGRPNITTVRHQSKPIDNGTFWSMAQSGSYPRGGANHNFYPFERTSTTEFVYRLTVLSETYVSALETSNFIPQSTQSLAPFGRLVLR